MVENTVEVNGVEFNAENLLAAVEGVLDEPMGEGSAQYGNVVVEDDGHFDPALNISTTDNGGTILTYINPTGVINKCEETIEQPFEDIVNEHLFDADELHKGEKATEFGYGYCCIVQSSFGFNTSQVQDFIQDGRISVGKFGVDGDENTPTIGLNDNR